MKSELRSYAWRGDGQQASRRERKPRRVAGRGVVSIPGRVQGHNHIVGVIASGEENADKRFVVSWRILLCQRANYTQAFELGRERRRTQSVSGSAQESSS